MYETGTRVGAMVSANKDEVIMFGYGIYEGDFVPPTEIIGPFGGGIKIKNPRIKLDSGEVVWGCECWWGPEDKIKEKVGTRKVRTITPKVYRSQAPD